MLSTAITTVFSKPLCHADLIYTNKNAILLTARLSHIAYAWVARQRYRGSSQHKNLGQFELMARTTPSLWDVLTVLASGLAGIIGQTRRESPTSSPAWQSPPP